MNMQLVEQITKKQLRNDIPDFKPGDTVKVYVKIKEDVYKRQEIESGAQENQLINELNEAKKRRDRLTESIQAKRELRMSFVNENEKIENTLKESRSHLRQIQSEMTEKQVSKAKQETELSNYLLRLNDEYKMTYEYAKEELATEVQMDEAKETVRILRHKIDSLGHVNLQSIEDYLSLIHI